MLHCDCGFEARAEDEEALVAEVRRHARDAHGMSLSHDEALLLTRRQAANGPSQKPISDRGTESETPSQAHPRRDRHRGSRRPGRHGGTRRPGPRNDPFRGGGHAARPGGAVRRAQRQGQERPLGGEDQDEGAFRPPHRRRSRSSRAGHLGWHSHPGLSFVIVKSGTATFYDGDDRTVLAYAYPAGSTAFEEEGHVHIVRNEGDGSAGECRRAARSDWRTEASACPAPATAPSELERVERSDNPRGPAPPAPRGPVRGDLSVTASRPARASARASRSYRRSTGRSRPSP